MCVCAFLFLPLLPVRGALAMASLYAANSTTTAATVSPCCMYPPAIHDPPRPTVLTHLLFLPWVALIAEREDTTGHSDDTRQGWVRHAAARNCQGMSLSLSPPPLLPVLENSLHSGRLSYTASRLPAYLLHMAMPFLYTEQGDAVALRRDLDIPHAAANTEAASCGNEGETMVDWQAELKAQLQQRLADAEARHAAALLTAVAAAKQQGVNSAARSVTAATKEARACLVQLADCVPGVTTVFNALASEAAGRVASPPPPTHAHTHTHTHTTPDLCAHTTRTPNTSFSQSSVRIHTRAQAERLYTCTESREYTCLSPNGTKGDWVTVCD